MSRCKACDVILTESELRKVDFNTNEHLELCYNCAVESNKALLEEDDRVDQSIDEALHELGFDLSNN
jgi:protein-arginine kinase activator protein McsA